MSDDRSSAAPGWYPDAAGGQRYWDGSKWTEHRAPAPTSSASNRKVPVWAWFIIVPVVGFTGLCLLGLFGFGAALNEIDKEDKKEEAIAAEGPPLTADVVVTPEQIVKEFEDNEFKADNKYQGQWIEVSGVVSKIDTEFDPDEYSLEVSNDAEDFGFESVTCHGMSKDDLSTVDKGQDVTVIGRFDDGGDFGVELKNCALR